jgi:hypothetical protein
MMLVCREMPPTRDPSNIGYLHDANLKAREQKRAYFGSRCIRFHVEADPCGVGIEVTRTQSEFCKLRLVAGDGTASNECDRHAANGFAENHRDANLSRSDDVTGKPFYCHGPLPGRDCI